MAFMAAPFLGLTAAQLAGVAVGVGALGALAEVRKGQAEQVRLNAEARQAELQGRVDALEYKRQGNESLRNLEKVLAANTARSAAGNVDPFASGESRDLIARLNMRDGVNEFSIARDNATIANKMAQFQAAQYRSAGKAAKQTGYLSALTTIGSSVVTAGQIK